MNDEIIVNHGVTDTTQDPNKWVAGGESGVVYEDKKIKFKEYCPDKENQAIGGFDDMSCVTHSDLNSIKTQFNFLITQDAHIHKVLQQKGMIINGKVEFDDQFVAIGSGTTPQGNDGSSVINFIRNFGLVAPGTIGKRGANISQYLDKRLLTPEILAKAKTFWADVGMQLLYEWMPTNGGVRPETLAFHVKQAPLQLFIRICPGYNVNSPVKACPIGPPQHAIMLYDEADVYNIFDSEVPNFKNLNLDYNIVAALKPVVSYLPVVSTKPKYHFNRTLQKGMAGDDVKVLQNILIYLGFLNVNLNTGYYGDNTKNAIMKLQTAHAKEILDPAKVAYATGNAGTFTIAWLNNNFS